MIEELRDKIDRIDEELVELLNRRAETALEIGKEKRRRDRRVTDIDREEEVIDHVRRTSSGPFSEAGIERIYRALISETKEVQKEVDEDDSGNEAGSNRRTN
ncbi:chorismate mutase [Candidatus Bipolaricaulota bacterium]|nr:chorismate mutase [Candidatus Bipolaricaulota bacterium]